MRDSNRNSSTTGRRGLGMTAFAVQRAESCSGPCTADRIDRAALSAAVHDVGGGGDGVVFGVVEPAVGEGDFGLG